jgi:hypothetical protein
MTAYFSERQLNAPLGTEMVLLELTLALGRPGLQELIDRSLHMRGLMLTMFPDHDQANSSSTWEHLRLLALRERYYPNA